MDTKNIQTISFIGSGKLGYHLAQRLHTKGLHIRQVFSRNIEKAKHLAAIVESEAINDLNHLKPNSDLYILAVSDDAIQSVIQQVFNILPKKSFLVHTSGATPSRIFEDIFKNYGIFYPLQSFSMEKTPDFEKIPICLDASNSLLLKQLSDLADQISPKVYTINDEQRVYLHLSAVFANNFTNYLFQIAQTLTKEHSIPFELLTPLILETAQKVQHNDAKKMQTGPAIRGDKATMKRHLELLKDHPDWEQLYQNISEQISKNKYKK